MIDNLPIVTIRCITYNHEPFIRKCLEGFVMQQTTFKFEVIVHDDASTDATAAIIAEFAEKYPDIIKPIYQTENQYSKRDGSIGRAIDAQTRGKYIAFCEGDDYWIDPLKLQKQVDFMEANPDYGLVYTDFKRVSVDGETVIHPAIYYNSSCTSQGEALIEDLLCGRILIRTVTVLIRKQVWDRSQDEIALMRRRSFLLGDVQKFCAVARRSKVKYFDYVSSAYTHSPNSATRGSASHRAKFGLSVAELKMEYMLNFDFSESAKKIFINRYVEAIARAKSEGVEINYYYEYDKSYLTLKNKLLIRGKVFRSLYRIYVRVVKFSRKIFK